MIALIPARGGSKRVPNKNIVEFCGLPLIAWTIQAALKAERFDEVYVDTDDEEIAEIARRYGANVPFLRATCADDHSTVGQAASVFLERLNDIEENRSAVCLLMANCPLRKASTIARSVEVFEGLGSGQTLISVYEPLFSHPNWTIRRESNDPYRSTFADAESSIKRSQDLGQVYMPTGSVWIADREFVVDSQSFYSTPFFSFPISWIEAIDIDTLEELEVARHIGRSILMAR